MNEDHKKKYQAGMAQLDFKPDFDWNKKETEELYHNAEFDINVDHIDYQNCIKGMKNLPDSSIDLVIADPPFGIDFDKIGSQYNRDEKFVVEGYNEVEMDYDQFTLNWIKELPRIMKNTGSAYIFSGWTNLLDVLMAIKKTDLTLVNHIIWKYQFGVFTRKKFVTSHYHILFLVKDGDQYFFNKIIHYPEDVWELPRKYRPGQRKNSTKLPEKVVTRCIDFSSKPGDLILDPFMGNGTTAVCAKGNYRHFYGFEMNENLKEIIEENLQSVSVGQFYKPYITYKPSPEELAEKYPAVRRYLEKRKREEGHKNLTEFL
ncbi:MAG: site-specific DNA-methyltransferase [Promethearchaeia archaeon]